MEDKLPFTFDGPTYKSWDWKLSCSADRYYLIEVRKYYPVSCKIFRVSSSNKRN